MKNVNIFHHELLITIIDQLLQKNFKETDFVNNMVDLNVDMLDAVRAGNLEKVQQLIDHYGLSYCESWLEGYGLLREAIKEQRTEVAELLLRNGSRVNSESENASMTPLHFAADNGDIEVVKMLVDKGAHVNIKANDNSTPLSIAVENGYSVIAEHLFNHGASINITSTSRSGYPLLHITAMKGNEELVRLLLCNHASVNARNLDGVTALHYAVMYEYSRVVELLLTHGANDGGVCTLSWKKGYTPLHIAVETGNEKIIRLLLTRCSTVNATTEDNSTPLHIAVKNDSETVIRVLLEYGAYVDAVDEMGQTALHIASQKGHANIVYILLQNGSDINRMTKNNCIPLDSAIAGRDSITKRSCNSQSDDWYNEYNNRIERFTERDISSFEIIIIILQRHMIKLMAANLYLNERNIRSVGTDERYDLFRTECEQEIENMKSKNISRNISFYDFLSKGINQLARYSKNENITQVLTTTEYKTKFPIYASIIELRFKKGMKRNNLLEQSNRFFHALSSSHPMLILSCFEKISSYLSDDDLINLINAC